MKKCLSVVILLAFALCIPAYAAQLRAYQANPNLTFSGTTAKCSAICAGSKNSDKIEATLSLYQNNRFVDSWSNSGTLRVSVSGNCAVEKGKTYVLVLNWSVNGVEQPSASVSKTCL